METVSVSTGITVLVPSDAQLESSKISRKIFAKHSVRLKLIAQANKRTVSYPDVTLDLTTSSNRPFKKPQNNLSTYLKAQPLT